MAGKLAAIFGLVLCLNSAGTSAATNDDFSVIVERYRQILLSDASEQQTTRDGRERTNVDGWMMSLGPHGNWPDVDYANKDRGHWKTREHVDRTRLMARALADPNDPLHSDAKLEVATLRALDYWITNRFRCPNGWQNRIGVPMAVRDIIVFLGDKLTGERRVAALKLLGRLGRSSGATGANAVWIAELGLQHGALSRDAQLVAESSRAISDEIKITTGEGIQPDYSFHQHAARLQQFHYGRAYLVNSVRTAWQLRGTQWEIPREKIQILADFVLQGCQWMCRGIYTAPSVIDRSVSRPGALAHADLRVPLNWLRELLPERARELDEFIARQNGEVGPPVGARVFPRSDLTVYHRPTFSCFVKTLSNRTLPAQVGLNGENLKGVLQDCGDHYLLRDGLEYFDLAPVWDWNLLPGVTYGEGAGSPQRQAFVGAVSDGQSCATAMDYRLGTKDRTLLRARKFWACHDDVMVALIGNLEAPAIHQPVRTALDQCLLRSAVTISDEQGVQRKPSGQWENVTANWVHHSGFAYAPLGGLKLCVRTENATGSWKSISTGLSPQPVSAPVFLAVLEHGASPTAQNSGFVVVSCDVPQAEKLFRSPSWHVLRNDSQVQAVKFNDGTLMAAFYQPGEVVGDEQSRIRVDKPCILIQRQSQVAMVDPTQQGGSVNLRAMGKLLKLNLPGGGAVLTAQ